MPLVNIVTAKEQALTYQPLLLADFLFVDGTHLRVASHPLNTAEGGVQYNGNDYMAAVLNYDITAVQAMSESGIDYTPQVQVQMADRSIWANYERSIGFKGATLTLTFTFYDPISKQFSSDAMVKFVGVCGSPSTPDTMTLTVTATSMMNMTQVQLPSVRIQRTCPWVFPRTAAERQAAADDESSQFWLCGYSPDATGGNKCGNYQSGSTPYTSCGYTYSDCLARLGNGADITHDTSNRPTGRFGGVQWQFAGVNSRGYISGRYEEIVGNSNEAKYGDLVPMVYGSGPIDPLIVSGTFGDANFTRFHALLGTGEFHYIYDVVVNGVKIPHTYNDAQMSDVWPGVYDNTSAAKSGWWRCINRGGRNGAVDPTIHVNERPDPYGNFCVIEIVVPVALAQANSTPKVYITADGPRVRVYYNSNPGGGTFDAASGKWWRKEFTHNLAWHELDALTWCNWGYDQINLDTFIAYAADCAGTVTYQNQFGGFSNHTRYESSLVIRQRRSGTEIVRGLRTAGCAMLYMDASGKLAIKAKKPLADQQPAPVTGSNYNTPVASMHVNGTFGQGYVAYKWDESNIAKKSGGGSSFSITQKSLQEMPNSVSVPFIDADNRFAQDSITPVDGEDVARVGQQITGSFPVEGLNNADQLYRVTRKWYAETYRGNPRDDTGGTEIYDWESTAKGVHLNVGDICLLTYQAKGIVDQLVRVIKIQPDSNFKRAKYTAMFHNDEWYTDGYGQQAPAAWSPKTHDELRRPPYAWAPNTAHPVAGSSMVPGSEYGFQVSQAYDTTADLNAVAFLTITGKQPVNVYSKGARPPFVAMQGSTSNTGGTIPGGTPLYVAVCALDSDGKLSAPSKVCTCYTAPGTATNTVTIPVTAWFGSPSGYAVFAGPTPTRLTYQGTGFGTPSSITLAGYAEYTWGVPDGEFDHLRFDVYRVRHSGTWGQVLLSCTGSTLTFPVLSGAGFSTDQFAGCDLSLLALESADPTVGLSVPICNFAVSANSAGTLTVTPDPTTIDRSDGTFGLRAGDVLVMRAKPTVGSDTGGNYAEDLRFVNNLNPLYDPYSIMGATNASPVEITTSVPHPFITGDYVYVQDVGGNTAANGLWQIVATGPDKFTLTGSSGNGTYTSGGTVQEQQRGLEPDAEVGNLIFFIAGTGKGTWAKIKSNTATRLYIEGDWVVTPDSTSRFVVLEPLAQQFPQASANNDNPDSDVIANITVNNGAGSVWFVSAVSIDGGGAESFPVGNPFREIYLYGQPEVTVSVTADYQQAPDDTNILVDTSAGPVTVQLLPSANMKAKSVMVKKMTADANAVTVLAFGDELIDGQSSLTLPNQWNWYTLKRT